MDDARFAEPTETVGEHLAEFMSEYGVRAPTLARRLGVPRSRVVRLLEGARCDGDMALRLAHAFATTPQFWLNLQAMRDLSEARALRGEEIARTVRPVDPAA